MNGGSRTSEKLVRQEMARRSPETLADYLVVAIAPLLIMLLVGSLMWFLVEVFYVGEHKGRLLWIMAMFVIAIVGIARISIEEGLAYASLFGWALAASIALALVRLVENGLIIGGPIMALTWWAAHKLTWDCTVIDEDQDVSGQGLLQQMGLDPSAPTAPKSPPGTTTPAASLEATTSTEVPATPPWWETLWEPDRRPHAPGVWVVYFSLAALPLFGIGGWFVPAADPARRALVFGLLVIYVACGMGLLLATSFLGLRRYLRQRKLEMPLEMTSTWIVVGVLMIVAMLLVAAILPRPSREYSLSQLPFTVTSAVRKANQFAFGKDGAKDDASQDKAKADPGESQKNEQSSDAKGKNSSGQTQGQSKNGSGKEQQAKKSPSEGQADGEQSKSDSNQSQSGHKGQASKSKSKSGQSKEGKSQGRNAESQKNQDTQQKDTQQKDKQQNSTEQKQDDDRQNEQQNQRQDRQENNQDQQRQEQQPPESSSTQRPAPNRPSPAQAISQLTSFLGTSLSFALRWIFYAALLVGLVVAVWYYRDELREAWAKLLLELNELLDWWFGRKKPTIEAAAVQAAVVPPPRSFASYSDPFATGQARGMSWPQLVRYTFEALEAWGREHACPRATGQTAQEFALALAQTEPQVGSGAQWLATCYGQLAYAPQASPPTSVDPLRALWAALGSR